MRCSRARVSLSGQANSALGTVRRAFRPDVRDSPALGHRPNWVIHDPAWFGHCAGHAANQRPPHPAAGHGARVRLDQRLSRTASSAMQSARCRRSQTRLDSTARCPKPPPRTDVKRRRRPWPGSSGFGPRTPRCACAFVPLSGPGNHRCASPSRVRAVLDCRVGGALLRACQPRRPLFLSEPVTLRDVAAPVSPRRSSARVLP